MDNDFEDSAFEDDIADDPDVTLNGSLLFTIEKQTKYVIVVNQIKSLEEAGDVFYTSQEISEMTGEKHIYGHMHTVVMRKAVERALCELKSKLGPTKKSIIIDDIDLIEFLNGEATKQDGVSWKTTYAVSDFVKGLRRVGNRLFLHEAKKSVAKLTTGTYDKIISICQSLMTQQLRPQAEERKYYGLEFSVKYAYENRVGVIEMFKKLIGWSDVEKELTSRYDQEGFIEIAKKVWDDPKTNLPPAKE